MKKTFTLWSVLFLGLCALSIESAVPPKNIALTNLAANGISEQEATVLTDVLRSNLSVSESFQVLERAKMDEVLKEQGFQKSGVCDESSCALEMGQLLGVDYMGVGSIGLVGKTYAVNVRLVDVRTGKIINDVNEFFKGSRDDLMVKVMPVIANKLSCTEQSKITVEKKSGRKWLIGVAAVGIVSVAVPVAILTKRESDEEDPMTEVRVRWNR